MISPKSPYPVHRHANVSHKKLKKVKETESSSLSEGFVSKPVAEQPIVDVPQDKMFKIASITEVEELTVEQETPAVGEPLQETRVTEEVVQPEEPQPIVAQQTEATVEPVVQEPAVQAETPKTHYFYCRKPTGAPVTYKRNTQSKTYASEIESFRKYLASQNIQILSEEVK